eukprot:6625646-Pyramimonas_sp.AAC.1
MPLLQDVRVRCIMQSVHGLIQRLVLHGPERVPHVVFRIDGRRPAPRHPPGKRSGGSNRPRPRTSWQVAIIAARNRPSPPPRHLHPHVAERAETVKQSRTLCAGLIVILRQLISKGNIPMRD